MADQKNQHSDPHAEKSTRLPLKKRHVTEKTLPRFIPLEKSAVAGKSLPGPIIEADSEFSDVNDDEEMIEKLGEEFKEQKLNELKRKAFYSVLLAFRVETLTIGNKRTRIIERLMNECNIDQETRISFEDNIQKNLLAQQERVDSDVKEAKPLTIYEKNTTCVATPNISWGINPESLVGRRVHLRMPCEEHFEDWVIKEYNAKDGMHRLETTDSNEEFVWMDLRDGMHRLETTDSNEEFVWMDLREVPHEDIIW